MYSIKEVVAVYVPVHTKRAFIDGFRKINFDFRSDERRIERLQNIPS